MSLPIVSLLMVFLLIMVRKLGNIKLHIWQIVLYGALAVLLTEQVSVGDALRAIDYDVLLFLFGVFIVGEALHYSGYLAHISYKYFKRAKSVDSLILFVLFGMGLSSAFLMNDTTAIIGTPVVLLLARKHKMHPQLMLHTLAIAITTGSVISPIGNPQNLLIAMHGDIPNLFVTFFQYLFIPTVINLFIAYVLLRLFYREHFVKGELAHSQEPIRDHDLALLSKVSLGLFMVLLLLKIVSVSVPLGIDFRLTFIALIAALPILLFSPKRVTILKRIDWYTLVFFAAIFVLMEAVWQTGFFQSLILSMSVDMTSTPVILGTSVVLSQLISNVPFVALFLPMLSYAGAGAHEMITLAAGSTIAGNLFIFGAASTVIIIQQAERRAGETLRFFQFAKVGVPLTLLNLAVYWVFLA